MNWTIYLQGEKVGLIFNALHSSEPQLFLGALGRKVTRIVYEIIATEFAFENNVDMLSHELEFISDENFRVFGRVIELEPHLKIIAETILPEIKKNVAK
jgi:hypothetical protein